MTHTRPQRGFTLLELLVALTILLLISGTVMAGLMQMSYTQGTITNRSEMHASVRSATELMQQEIGQSGRIAVNTNYTLAAAVPAGTSGTSQTVALSSSSGLYPGLYTGVQLYVGTQTDAETVTVTNWNPATSSITAIFNNVPSVSTNPVHASGAPVNILGTFSSGVVPDTMTNGSGPSVLKLYGDINGDGNMVYIEYKCDTAAGKLYRNSMAYNAGSKPAVADSMILLPNILANPGNAACFTYQEKTVGADTYVVNVAVTLTVQTEQPDLKTHIKQQETKALLNVSPRNVFEGWELASAGITNRNQPIPPTVTALLP